MASSNHLSLKVNPISLRASQTPTSSSINNTKTERLSLFLQLLQTLSPHPPPWLFFQKSFSSKNINSFGLVIKLKIWLLYIKQKFSPFTFHIEKYNICVLFSFYRIIGIFAYAQIFLERHKKIKEQVFFPKLNSNRKIIMI